MRSPTREMFITDKFTRNQWLDFIKVTENEFLDWCYTQFIWQFMHTIDYLLFLEVEILFILWKTALIKCIYMAHLLHVYRYRYSYSLVIDEYLNIIFHSIALL